MLDINNYRDCKESGILKLDKKLSTLKYILTPSRKAKIIMLMEELANRKLTEKDLMQIHKTSQNKCNKTLRVKKRIKKILEKNKEPVFITLTFNEKYINTTKHRRYIREFLNEQCEDYIANIDYGEKNERMHYHAVSSNKINPKKWRYGNCDVKLINKPDEKALGKYLTKLTSHALKNTAGQEKIITKRRKKK